MRPAFIEIYGLDTCPQTAGAIAFCVRKEYRHIYYDVAVPRNSARLNHRKPDAEGTPHIFIGVTEIGGLQDLHRADERGLIQQIIGGS